MQIWDARVEDTEKVFFLFSINGTKQYCGLAEVSGPWNPNMQVEGWTDPSSGFVGSFPLTWNYVKNVPYARFAHLKHGEKNQPIANMWSGQHISPSDPLGRQVIEVFVAAPHISNILAWGKGQGPAGSVRGGNINGHQSANVRAARGNHTGGPGRGETRAMDRNWRGLDNNPPGVGRAIGEVEANGRAPIAARRNVPELTVQTAPLPQTDGTFESAGLARPGQLVTFMADGKGGYVAVGPEHPQTAKLGMPNRDYINRYDRQARSADAMHGPDFGSFRGGRGGLHSGQRGGKSPVVVHNHDYGGLEKQPGLGISSDSQSELHHAISNATLKFQHSDGPPVTQESKLQHAAFAPDFVPKLETNRSLTQSPGGTAFAPRLHHATSTMSFSSQMQHGGPPHLASKTSFASHVDGPHLHHNASNASFATYSQVTNPSDYGVTATNPANAQHHNQSYVKHHDQRSQDSYPSHFRSVDSMAGYDGRYMKNHGQPPRAQRYPMPPLIRNLREVSPTQLPKHADPKQNTEDWVEKTPTHHSISARTAVDVASVPLGKRATYFHLMADMAKVDNVLAGMCVDADPVEYYRTMAQKAELESMMVRFTLGKAVSPEGSVVGGMSHGSEAGSAAPSSINVRAEDGRALPSVSQSGESTEGRRKSGHERFASLDKRVKNDLEVLMASPPSSTKAEHHGSPVDSVAAMSSGETDVASQVTNPFAEETGGISLMR
ncbi:hypothetical protein LTR53_015364 [Teratosphaeriaceae sp. CCFEE 6253]|nr:hypothetical protein LTR53_015364 [Teratosphaeriaceae sp. CCFEE 6253]